MSSNQDTTPPPEYSKEVCEVLAEYLRSHDPSDAGPREALYADHPEFSDQLREALQEWVLTRGVVPKGGELISVPEFLTRHPARVDGPDASGVASGSHSSTRSIVKRLSERKADTGRYENKGEIDRGGMGVISRIWDPDLQRTLAMKSLIGEPQGPDDSHWRKKLARFLEEAQVTSQLDHPGVVPVHEMGLDEKGRAYFTMKLVRGQTLSEIFKLCRSGDPKWTTTRIVVQLIKVCEAVSYAHDKGVLHRDLKPANVMVGRFGEVYVMDWGLARVMEREEESSDQADGTLEIHSLRHAEEAGDSIRTTQGDVFGTIPYMPPEQAAGQLDRMGPHSDVYAVGAMIYTLLAGHAPFVISGERASYYALLERARKHSPQPLAKEAPAAPPELIAICEKAMSREIEARYATCDEMVGDLRAYIEGRVVAAYRAGPLIELRKWVARNRATAVAAGLALATAMIGAVLIALSEGRRARIAREGEQNVQQLLDRHLVEDLNARADELWPVHPDTVPALEQWLAEAAEVGERTQALKERTDQLRERALPYEEEERLADRARAGDGDSWWLLRKRRDSMIALIEEHRDVLAESRGSAAELAHAEETVRILVPEVASLTQRLETHERRVSARRTWRFEDPLDRALHEELAPLVDGLHALQREPDGQVALIEARLAAASPLRQRSIEEQAAAWGRAIASIADRSDCPDYDGLVLEPVIGLVPLRRNPRSKLWEFWHVLSGDKPEIGADGRPVLTDRTGLVFILIPPGEVEIGAQARDSEAPRYDPDAPVGDGPPTRLVLDAYFISKYEMTQAQWLRLAGTNPSEIWVGSHRKGWPRVAPTHPVEHVSWSECEANLARWNLVLPTEAQWECAARAGTESRYGHAQRFAQVTDSHNSSAEGDGHLNHAPVDCFDPNPFGLYNALGNVAEWTRDWHVDNLAGGTPAPGTGELIQETASGKTCRGGSFDTSAFYLRMTSRYKRRVDYRARDLGIRPVSLLP